MGDYIKRFFLFSTSCFIGSAMYAQAQLGYVRTIGRHNQKGVALSGVSIRVQGEHNAVLSGADGVFSFPMNGKKNGEAYSLQQVRKLGYELNDIGMIGRRMAYSDHVPLKIVMVSTKQLQTDKQRIENKAYEVAQKNYKNKLALLEKQLSDGTVNAERYRKELKELQDKFEKYQSLIDDLAEHYAHTDYDLLDEKERQINICIENGELERADSLLQNVFDPIGVLERNIAAFSRIEQSEREGHLLLDQARADMEKVLRQQEKDAEHLYQLYTIALSRFDNEKAAFYIKTRAELDTTNVEWQMQAGGFLYQAALYSQAEWFFSRALRHNPNSHERSYCFFNNGRIKAITGNIEQAKVYFEKALNTLDKEDNNVKTRALPALIDIEAAEGFYKEKNYQNALSHYKQALTIFKSLADSDYDTDIVASMLGIANTNYALGNYSEADSDADKAILLLQGIKNCPPTFFVTAYVTKGAIYYGQGHIEQSKAYLEKALALALQSLGNHHPEVANIYNNLSILYMNNGDDDKAMEYMQEGIRIYSNLNSRSETLATLYLNAGRLYKNKKDYDNAIVYYDKARQFYIRLYGEDHPVLAKIYDFIGVYYAETENYRTSLFYLNKALELYRQIYSPAHENIRIAEKNISIVKSEYDKLLQAEISDLNQQIQDFEIKTDEDLASYCLLLHNFAAALCRKEEYKWGIEIFDIALKQLSSKQPTDAGLLYLMANICNDQREAYRLLGKESKSKKCERMMEEYCKKALDGNRNTFKLEMETSNTASKTLSERLGIWPWMAKRAYKDDPLSYFLILTKVGKAFLNIGDTINAEQDFHEALIIANKLQPTFEKEITIRTGDNETLAHIQLRDTYLYLSEIERSRCNYSQSAMFLKKYLCCIARLHSDKKLIKHGMTRLFTDIYREQPWMNGTEDYLLFTDSLSAMCQSAEWRDLIILHRDSVIKTFTYLNKAETERENHSRSINEMKEFLDRYTRYYCDEKDMEY